MIFFGYGCDVFCMMPIGRQCASGLSLLWSAIRFLANSAAHGCASAPPGTVAAPRAAAESEVELGGKLREPRRQNQLRGQPGPVHDERLIAGLDGARVERVVHIHA